MRRKNYNLQKSDGLNLVLFEPGSDWAPPKASDVHFGNSKFIGIDVETYDPELRVRGPGGIRGIGHLAGISLSSIENSYYLPIAHLAGGNMDPKHVKRLATDLNREGDITWVGANLQYELEWLNTIGLSLSGKFIDVQAVESLIDEEAESVSLDTLARKYLGVSKNENLLREAAAAHGVDPKSGLWKLNSKFVGPYAEADAKLPLLIFREQLKILEKEDLMEIFDIEMRLLPLMWEMRREGIWIDLDAAAKLSEELGEKEKEARFQCWKISNCHVDEWSGPMIASVCDRLNILYPRTDKGNPSFEGKWLDDAEHPFLKSVATIRELNRLRSTFIDKWIFGHIHNGRIHPQWKQLASDDGGTRTGRMAAANPNPQQVPSRSDIAPLIRKLFIPPSGLKWAKYDYSQQEPRLAVHFAHSCGFASAGIIRLAYKDNRDTDIYGLLAESAQVSRRESKTITLGRFYGMGVGKLAKDLGVSEDNARSLFDRFDRAVPFVRELSDLCISKVQQRGWLKTLYGRKRHFNFWEPTTAYDLRKQGLDCRPRRREEAEAKWPKLRLQRAFTHKALNSLIQGSAADMIKVLMLRLREEKKKIPIMAVHDEVNYAVEDRPEADKLHQSSEQWDRISVPMKVDMHYGDHWK